jgi:hypothetical protein
MGNNRKAETNGTLLYTQIMRKTTQTGKPLYLHIELTDEESIRLGETDKLATIDLKFTIKPAKTGAKTGKTGVVNTINRRG